VGWGKNFFDGQARCVIRLRRWLAENLKLIKQLLRQPMKKTILTTHLRAAKISAMLVAASLLMFTGCDTTQPKQTAELPHSESLILREGDVLKISFPGSPNLDTTQQIRRDGKIALQLAGEVDAVGVTPTTLETNISNAYGDQLSSKQVTVVVVSSSIPIFVTGAVLKPETITSDHPITAFEAIMQAGGPDYAKANLKDVRVIRFEKGREHTYFLNLKDVLAGKQVEPFYLKPYDSIYVPERFQMF
jgi:polysaccharide export outer membrane protein